MESLFSRRGMAVKQIDTGDGAEDLVEGGGSGDGDVADGLSGLAIVSNVPPMTGLWRLNEVDELKSTNSGPYASGDMDQFERTVDFESSYTPSDASEKKTDKKGLTLFGRAVSHCR